MTAELPRIKRARRGIVFLCAGLVGAGLLGFVLGSQYFTHNMKSMRQKLASLSTLEQQYADQQQQLVNLEMADQVNRLAQENLRQRVTELQTEQVKLESDIYVYKKLLEDDEAEAGLNLESLSIRPVESDPNRFNYEIVLRRNEALSQSVEASLSLDIEGRLHGIPYSMAFKEADPDMRDEAMSVSFKYFKILKGQFVLPEHFEPTTVVISLYEAGRADSLVIKEIPWEPAVF